MVLGNDQDGISITSLGGNSDIEDAASPSLPEDQDPFSKVRKSFGETKFGKIVDKAKNGIDAEEIDIDGPADTGNSDSIYQDNSGSNNGGNNSGDGGIPSFDTGKALNMGLPEFNAESLKDNFEQNTENAQNNINKALNDLTGQGKGLNLPGIGLKDLKNMVPGKLGNPGNNGGGSLGLITKIGIIAVLALSIPKVIEAMHK